MTANGGWRSIEPTPRSADQVAIIARLVTTPEALAELEGDESLEGYRDGRDNAPPPGANRSNAYVQGWWAGMKDGRHRDYHPIDSDIARAGLIRLRQLRFP